MKSIKKTTALFSTNPRLTGNMKIVADTIKDTISLEPLYDNYDDVTKFPIDTSNSLGFNISNFFNSNDFGTEFFDVNNGNVSNETLVDDFGEQIDDSLQWGARKETNSNGYDKIRFLAPIWITPTTINETKNHNIPSHFVLFKKKIDFNSPNNDTEVKDLVNNGEIVGVYDILNNKIGQTLKSHINDQTVHELNGSPLQFGLEKIRWYGINLNTGIVDEYVDEFTDTLQNEQPIMSIDNYLTNGWVKNGAVVPNMFNIEFVFDDKSPNDFEYYTYFGAYINVVEEHTINSDNWAETITNLLVPNVEMDLFRKTNTDLLSFVFSNDKIIRINELETDQKSNIPTDLTISKPVSVINSGEIELIKDVKTRKGYIGMKKDITLSNGDEIEVMLDGNSIFSIEGGVTNTLNTYKIESDDLKTLQNIVDGLNKNFKLTDYFYNFSAKLEKDNILIDSNSFVDGFDYIFILPDKLYSKTTTISELGNNRLHLPILQKPNNTIIINSSKTIDTVSYNQDELIDKLIKSNKINIRSNKVDIDTTLKEVTQINESIFITFNDSFELNNNQNDITMTVFNLSDSDIKAFKYVDMGNFDNTMKKEFFENYKDFNTDKFKADLISRVDDGYVANGYQIPPFYFKIEDYFRNQDDLQTEGFIEKVKLNENSVEVAETPYKRFNEFDTVEYAPMNVVNIMLNKWGNDKGDNAVNKVHTANSSLAYGINNFVPSQTAENTHRYNDYISNWFIIGTQPPLYEIDTDTKKSYCSKNGLSREMLESETLDAYKEYLEYDIVDGDYKRSENAWSIVYQKPDSEIGNVFFRGVSYNVPKEVVGYKFSIVYIPNILYANKPSYKVIKNDTFKTYTITFSYRWTYDLFTSLWEYNEDGNSTRYYLDRSMFYNTNSIERNNNVILGQSVLVDMDIGVECARVRDSVLYNNTFYLGTNANNNSYAIDYVNISNDIVEMNNISGFHVGGNMAILFPLGAGWINFVNITEIHEDYFWCTNVVYAKTLGGIPQIFSFDDFLTSNSNDTSLLTATTQFDEVKEVLNNSAYLSYTNNRMLTDLSQFYLVNAKKRINSLDDISINEPDENYITTHIESFKGELSYNLGRKVNPYAMTINRYNISCTPIVNDVFLSRNIELNGKTFDNMIYSNNLIIKKYGIFKYGDGNTLSTDGYDEKGLVKVPAHTEIGETITDKIDYNPYINSLNDGFYKKYSYRKTYDDIDGKESPNDLSSIVSTIFKMSSIHIYTNINTEGEFTNINVKELITNHLKTFNTYSSVDSKILDRVSLEILQNYTPTFTYFDNENVEIKATVYEDASETIIDGILVQKFDDYNNIKIDIKI